MERSKKKVDYPLFPGYLFVHIVSDPGEFLKVVTTRGSVSFVSLEPGHPSVVSPEEIASLKIALGSGEQIDVFPSLKEGTLVRVKRGPLYGAVGILAKRENHHLFLINIDILGRSVGMKICAEDIEQA